MTSCITFIIGTAMGQRTTPVVPKVSSIVIGKRHILAHGFSSTPTLFPGVSFHSYAAQIDDHMVSPLAVYVDSV